MSITLKNLKTQEIQELPPELYWVDEFDWVGVKGNHKRSCTGSLLVLQSIARGGRPFTIGAKSDMDWTPRHVVEKLFSWANTVGLKVEIALNTDGDEHTYVVMFDTSAKPIEAKPVREYNAPSPTDDFHLTIHFIEVQQ